MNSASASEHNKLVALHIVVLEPDPSRVTSILAMLKLMLIDKVSIAASLQEISATICERKIDVIISEIRPDSSEGLMLPSLLKMGQESNHLSVPPRILWLAEKTYQFMGVESGHKRISIKALHAHMQLARAAGLAAMTVYSPNAQTVSEALCGLLSMPTTIFNRISAGNNTPSEEDVVSALATGDGLRVVFQPQHDLRSGKIIGAEALVRWRHEKLGDIPPATLIPLVNKLGLHLLLFSFVKAKVLDTLRTLQARQLDIPISVNASVDTVCTAGFSERLDDRMQRADLPNYLLKIELTEDIPVVDELSLSAALNALRARGFSISLDDFGAGSASLRQLSRLPFDEVKIDGSLIRGMVHNPSARRIVATTLALVHRLSMSVVAEGIETESCRVLLRRLGCVNGQGFALSRPMEEADFLKKVGDQNCPPFAGKALLAHPGVHRYA
ncbi:EAL domain-containing protein [Pseudomonas frederiksbergensis]|uniref:EAL domain-containing protein n=1 Tax=Pseudomonas frederiksbergensis TaxID=104087 RepID=UPI003CFCC090